MKNVTLKWLALAVMLATGATTTAAEARNGAAPTRPSSVPAEFVITPFGYFHPTCVGHLAKGDELRPDEHIIRHKNGSSDAMHVCAYPHYRADGEQVVGDEHHVKHPDISHAWLDYASVTTSTAYSYLYAEWTVPPTPASNDGQTLFFFPGLEDINDVVTIVQPVLGWNSDYASAWGIASWNCCESGTTYEATPEPANPGDTILGYMFDTCGAGVKTCGSWDIVTWDIRNGQFSQLLNTSNFGQTFNWAFAGAVEVYNIAQCTDFPSSGGYPGSNALSFNEIGLFNSNGVQNLKPKWSVTNNAGGLTPQCGYGGSTPNQVILTY